jgi:hypothetical protein
MSFSVKPASGRRKCSKRNKKKRPRIERGGESKKIGKCRPENRACDQSSIAQFNDAFV